jgi:transcriptional regulator with XRE-family HTH domain
MLGSVCSDWHMSPGEKVRTLRKALGLTQSQLAERSGGTVVQGEVAKVEGGRNKLSTLDLTVNLAGAFGLSLDQFRSYLSDEADLKATVARVKSGAVGPRTPAKQLRLERDPVPAIAAPENASPLVHAVTQALDKNRHLVTDATVVINTLHNDIDQHQAVDVDLIEKARVWLDAAAALRKEGKPINAGTLLDRVTEGKTPRLAPDEDDEFQKEIAAVAEKHGMRFGQAMAAVEAFQRGAKKPTAGE